MAACEVTPRRRSFVLFVLLFLLAACGSVADIAPTNTFVVGSPPTQTPLSTATSKPTGTPTASLTFTPTPNPTWVAVLNTEAFLSNQTQIARQPLNDTFFNSDYCYSILVSPNGNNLSCTTEEGIIIHNKASSSQLTITQNDIFPDSSADIILSPLLWSNDNARLFFTASACCQDGPGFLGGQAFNGLWIFNTNNNTILALIKEPDEFRSPYYFSISPTNRRLVYINELEEPLTLSIQDLQAGSTQNMLINKKLIRAGYVLWSSDGTKFIFVGISGDNAPFTPDARISLYLVDASNLEIKELISDSEFMLTPIRWENNSTIVLRAETGNEYVPTDGAYWYYDLNNFQLINP